MGYVTSIDVASLSVRMAHIEIGGVFGSPTWMAVTPNGRYVYVLDSQNSTVTPIVVAYDRPGAPIDLPGGPLNIVITPNGAKAYVYCQAGYPTFGTVAVVDLASNAVIATITVGSTWAATHGNMAVTPDGSKVYAASQADFGEIAVIDVATDTVTTSIDVTFPGIYFLHRSVVDMGLSPDGEKIYVSVQGQAYPSGESVDYVTPIFTATDTVGVAIEGPYRGGPFRFYGGPGPICFTSDSSQAFVGSLVDHPLDYPRLVAIVTPIDVATDTARSEIGVGSIGGFGMALDETLFLSEAGGRIIPIDSTTDLAAPFIDSGYYNVGREFVFTPDGVRGFVLGSDVGVGTTVVVPILISARTVSPGIFVGGGFDLVRTPNGRTLYVSNTDLPFPPPVLNKAYVRQIQRDDLGGRVNAGAGANRPTSRQQSVRVGGKNTYW